MATGTKTKGEAKRPRERITLEQAMRELEAAGTEQNRKLYRRHGAREPLFGVSFANLRSLAKRARPDQELAQALWATGNTDARLLASMVADPAAVTEAELDAWVDDIDYYVLVDIFTRELASKVPGMRERAERWMASDAEWVGQAGWDLVAHMAMKDTELDDAYFLDRLATIEREIAGAKNRVRHAMNGALIAIGIRNERLEKAAREAARRIGTVVVDHGETGCVTPEAIPYIERTLARRAAKAAR